MAKHFPSMITLQRLNAVLKEFRILQKIFIYTEKVKKEITTQTQLND